METETFYTQTLSHIRSNPETLGTPVTANDVAAFARLVASAMDAHECTEDEAIEIAWNGGDWYALYCEIFADDEIAS